MTFSDIKAMTENRYKNIIRIKCDELAFTYLMNKRGSKGKEIIYPAIKMSKYLLPNDNLTIKEQRKIFLLRNKMNNIPANYSATSDNMAKCICDKREEDNEHLYYCEYLNKVKPLDKFIKS